MYKHAHVSTITIKRSLSIDLFHFDSINSKKNRSTTSPKLFPHERSFNVKKYSIFRFLPFHNSKRNEKKKISNEIQVLFSKLTRHGWDSPAGRWRTSMNIRRCTPFCPILSPLTPTNWPNIAKLTRTDEPRVVQPLHVARPPYFPRGIPERNWTWAEGFHHLARPVNSSAWMRRSRRLIVARGNGRLT